MSAENQDQDFEKLQRLLKLKRHELPPPRFFNEFSGNVTARLRVDTGGDYARSGSRRSRATWLQRLWQNIEGNPAVSGIASVAICGLVVLGLVVAEKPPTELPQFTAGNSRLSSTSSNPEQTKTLLFADSPAAFHPVSSTNPMAVLPDSLFNSAPLLQTFPTAGKVLPAGAK